MADLLPALPRPAAQNAFNGIIGARHCCHNDCLLNKILKDEWGFKGFVIFDWVGTHDARPAALNGLDLEMGTEKKIQRLLSRVVNAAAHQEVARKVTEEGVVLLKNEIQLCRLLLRK